MRHTATTIQGVFLACFVFAGVVEAQAGPQVHISQMIESSPEEAGFLHMALGEAAVVRLHARYAAGGRQERRDLASMKTHATHALHALDPTKVDGGPGYGVGVKQATASVIYHTEMAAASDGASPALRTHAEYALRAARNTMERVELMIDLVDQIRIAESADEAAPLVDELEALSAQLNTGIGGSGLVDDDGGLEQIMGHIRSMLRGRM